LDSTQTFDKVIVPKGALAGLASSSSDTKKSFFSTALGALWHHGILHDNRVEGITPDAWFDVDEMDMDCFLQCRNVVCDRAEIYRMENRRHIQSRR